MSWYICSLVMPGVLLAIVVIIVSVIAICFSLTVVPGWMFNLKKRVCRATGSYCVAGILYYCRGCGMGSARQQKCDRCGLLEIVGPVTLRCPAKKCQKLITPFARHCSCGQPLDGVWQATLPGAYQRYLKELRKQLLKRSDGWFR